MIFHHSFLWVVDSHLPVWQGSLGSWAGKLRTMPHGGGHFARGCRGLGAAPQYRPRPLCFNNVTKDKSKPALSPRPRMHPVVQGGNPGSGDRPHSLPRKPWMQLNTQKARASRGSGAQQGAWREGTDYLQAAGWQCLLLAAHRRDNGTERS